MFMYIVCVFCSFLLLSNSSCFVFLFQTKKNEKKYCSSYSIFARAHFSSHTLFDFKKLQVSRQDLYISPYKKLFLSLLALRAIPAIYHAFRCPCCRQKISVCLKHSDWPAIETHCRNRREEDGSVSVLPKILFLFPTRWWSPVVAGGDTRSTLSSFKAAPDPVIGVCGVGAKSPLSFFWHRNSNSRIVRVSNTKIVLF